MWVSALGWSIESTILDGYVCVMIAQNVDVATRSTLYIGYAHPRYLLYILFCLATNGL